MEKVKRSKLKIIIIKETTCMRDIIKDIKKKKKAIKESHDDQKLKQ